MNPKPLKVGKGIACLALVAILLVFGREAARADAPELADPNVDIGDSFNKNSSGNADENELDPLRELESLLDNNSEGTQAQSALPSAPQALPPVLPKLEAPPKIRTVPPAVIPAKKPVEKEKTVTQTPQPPKPVAQALPPVLPKLEAPPKIRTVPPAVIPAKKPVEKEKTVTQTPQPPKPVAQALRPTWPVVKMPKTQNEIVAIDFKVGDTSSFLNVKAKDALKYRMVREAKGQQISFFFQSTLAKKSLLRAYDTKEFKTPVAMYTLGRAKNKKKSELRLTVRLRDSVRPKIVNEENMLSMEFLNPTPKVAKRDVTSEPLPLPEFSNGDSNQVYTGAPLRKLELKGIDVREALRLITRFSGYNLILGEDVKGEIGSLSLENVPWDQALNLVLQTKKLGYVRHGNILRVATLQALTEEKEDKLKQEAAALLVEPLKTVFIPISFAKASDLQARAERFVSSRGTVDIDARTNMLIIRDTQAVINRLQKIFTVLDTPPTAVSISAKFVEAKKEFSRALGLGAFSLTGRTSGIDFGQSGGDTTTVEATALPGFGASSAGANINISAPDFAALTAQISLAEAEQKVKVLANPTIIVQQGETGTIRQNLETQVVQASAGSATVTSGLTQNAELKLEVAPIVTNDGSLLLTTQLQQDIPLAGASGQLKKDSRTVNTKIILDNGDTAVLGGIYSFQETNSDEGVPFLKNLPLLGYLFSAKGKNITQNEILVFVTGRILNGEQAFKQNM